MNPKIHPFRKTPIRPHHFPRLYFDADYVKTLYGSERLFSKETTEAWMNSAFGFKSIRHPLHANQSDPLCVMMLVDALMRIDIHSNISSHGLVPLMNKWYPDFQWDIRQVGRMLRTVFHCQKFTGAPEWGKWTALNSFRPIRVYEYSLYPDRETYIWLAKIRIRLEQAARAIVRQERKLRKRAIFTNHFDTRLLYDVIDPDANIPILEGIVFRAG